jgi:protein SCO1
MVSCPTSWGMKRFSLIPFLCLIAAGFLLAFLAYLWTHPSRTTPAAGLTPVTSDSFGGPLTSLTNHLGEKVTNDAFDGQYRLIYFGFTYCPAICPTELQKISLALKNLGADADSITPIFITVDPARDTVEKMKDYVGLFHPRLVGLTGTQSEIDGVLKEYKVYAAKVEDPKMSDYTMDHSSFIYFIAPDGRLLHIFKMDDSAQVMQDVITRWISK